MLIHICIVYSCFHATTEVKNVVKIGTMWPAKLEMFTF